MVKIGIISDTHVSEKRGKLNEKIFDYFCDVDLIFHIGDVTSQKVLDELSVIAPVTAVKGNNDNLNLEFTECIEINNFLIVLNHGTGYSTEFNRLYEFGNKYGADILITGHTHSPHNEIIGDILLLNPGSARGKNSSIAILNINEKDKLITDIDINFINL
jgi:putative phosphoesterase